MPEEPTTPDLVDRYRRTIEAANRGDFDAVMSFWGPAPVWDTSPAGMGTFEGSAAVRGFFEDWVSSYQEYEIEAEEIADLGNGVTYAIVLQRGRPAGSNGEVRVRSATVGLWVNGLLIRVTNYPDIDVARADAERLAAERG
jgi:ketosteroid isomerase-like protein